MAEITKGKSSETSIACKEEDIDLVEVLSGT